MQTSSIELGKQAECRAKKFLSGHKLKAIAENYRTRLGEIDLIMYDGPVLVFIEVRYRQKNTFGYASESIDRKKQGRIIRAACEFLKTHSHKGPVRFDIVTFDGSLHARPNWIRDSFHADW